MSIPTLTRAERKRVERELYANIRNRFDQDMPKLKKRYTRDQFHQLAGFLSEKTTAVMLGIVHEAMRSTRGVTNRHIEQVMDELKKYKSNVKPGEGDMLRKEVVDSLATIQMTCMFTIVDMAIKSMERVKGIGPKRHSEAANHISRLLRENS